MSHITFVISVEISRWIFSASLWAPFSKPYLPRRVISTKLLEHYWYSGRPFTRNIMFGLGDRPEMYCLLFQAHEFHTGCGHESMLLQKDHYFWDHSRIGYLVLVDQIELDLTKHGWRVSVSRDDRSIVSLWLKESLPEYTVILVSLCLNCTALSGAMITEEVVWAFFF